MSKRRGPRTISAAPHSLPLRPRAPARVGFVAATQALLLDAVRAAPRRYRLPPLPADVAAARAAEPQVALAFAIEHARLAVQAGVPPSPDVRDLFAECLARLIATAVRPDAGDAAFQAQVLRASDPQVAHYVRLAAAEAVHRRSLRTRMDALAHPGKLRGVAPGAVRDALAQLHAAAVAQDWALFAAGVEQHLAQATLHELHPALDVLQRDPALQALLALQRLATAPAVQRYLALCARRGPLAGSDAAASSGRAAARLGDAAEQAAVAAFDAIAAALERHESGHAAGPAHRVAAGLRMPPGFPGAAGKAKDEWDVALVRSPQPGAAADLLLLAEVKAAPAAATSDFSRLHRGLERLALADPARAYDFPAAGAPVRLTGASLQALRPAGRALPPQVVYCCQAPPEAQPQLLAAATQSVLLSEPASLAFAQRLLAGAAPPPRHLAPVWEALASEPRLRAALHQDPTARMVREAMVHPQDLVGALRTRAHMP